MVKSRNPKSSVWLVACQYLQPLCSEADGQGIFKVYIAMGFYGALTAHL